MLRSPPVSSSLSPAIATSPRRNVVKWTASINGSPTISTLSYPQSASRPLLNQSNENKILVSRCIRAHLCSAHRGLLKPFAGDRNLAPNKRCQLDRLYQRLTDDLDALLSAVGLKTAA